MRFPYREIHGFEDAQGNFEALEGILSKLLAQDGGGLTVTWAGGTAFSALATVPHSLGVIPTRVLATVSLSANAFHAFAVPRNVTSTQFQVEAYCPQAAFPPAGDTAALWWEVKA